MGTAGLGLICNSMGAPKRKVIMRVSSIRPPAALRRIGFVVVFFLFDRSYWVLQTAVLLPPDWSQSSPMTTRPVTP